MIGDYYSVLREAIEATDDNPADMRRVIFEIARAQLEKKLRAANPPLSPQSMREEQDALEAVFRLIDAEASVGEGANPRAQQRRVGSTATDAEAAGLSSASGQTGATSNGGFSVLPPKMQPASSEPAAVANEVERWRPGQQFRTPRFSRMLQVLLAVVVGGAVAGGGGYALMQAKSGRGDFSLPFWGSSSDPMQTTLAPGRRMNATPPASDQKAEPFQHPLPVVYGVFALQNAKLTELRPLTLFAERAAEALALVSEPSRIVLPHGQLAFIVFRRALLSQAPERMLVNVVARVAQETNGAGSVATTASVVNQWIVRRAAHEFRVAPIAGQPEMVLVRHEQPNFELPPGRYALLVADQAFDFLVAGRVTDSAHCVERTHTADAIIYADCPGGGTPPSARGGRPAGQ